MLSAAARRSATQQSVRRLTTQYNGRAAAASSASRLVDAPCIPCLLAHAHSYYTSTHTELGWSSAHTATLPHTELPARTLRQRNEVHGLCKPVTTVRRSLSSQAHDEQAPAQQSESQPQNAATSTDTTANRIAQVVQQVAVPTANAASAESPQSPSSFDAHLEHSIEQKLDTEAQVRSANNLHRTANKRDSKHQRNTNRRSNAANEILSKFKPQDEAATFDASFPQSDAPFASLFTPPLSHKRKKAKRGAAAAREAAERYPVLDKQLSADASQRGVQLDADLAKRIPQPHNMSSHHHDTISKEMDYQLVGSPPLLAPALRTSLKSMWRQIYERTKQYPSYVRRSRQQLKEDAQKFEAVETATYDTVPQRGGTPIATMAEMNLPAYSRIPSTAAIDYSAIPSFVTSSRDKRLHSLATRSYEDVKFLGSTSSVSTLLAQMHFCLLRFRPVNRHLFTPQIQEQTDRPTKSTRKPSAVLLRKVYKHHYTQHSSAAAPTASSTTSNNPNDYLWSIDTPAALPQPQNQVLIDLGHVVERLLTTTPEHFNSWFLKKTGGHRSQSKPHTLDCYPHDKSPDATHKETDHPVREPTPAAQPFQREAYTYMKFRSMFFRSQIDCREDDITGGYSKLIDLKSRATLPIRLDCANHHHYLNYELEKTHGLLYSYEREYYDMARSAFLKYSMQCRIGKMNGVMVAYHNTQKLFGLQYVPLFDMNRVLMGSQHTANLAWSYSNKLLDHTLNQIVTHAEACQPLQDIDSLRLTVDTPYNMPERMYIWVETVSHTLDPQQHVDFIDRYAAPDLAHSLSPEDKQAALLKLQPSIDINRLNLNEQTNLLESLLTERRQKLDRQHEVTGKGEDILHHYATLAQKNLLRMYYVSTTSKVNGRVIARYADTIIKPETDEWIVDTDFQLRTLDPLSMARLYLSVHKRARSVDDTQDAAQDDDKVDDKESDSEDGAELLEQAAADGQAVPLSHAQLREEAVDKASAVNEEDDQANKRKDAISQLDELLARSSLKPRQTRPKSASKKKGRPIPVGHHNKSKSASDSKPAFVRSSRSAAVSGMITEAQKRLFREQRHEAQQTKPATSDV